MHTPFIDEVAPFLNYAHEWQNSLPEADLDTLIEQAGGPAGLAVVVVDLIKGFCCEGPLASPRVQALVEPVCRLLQACHQRGVRRFLFPCDAHPQNSPEFDAFPPHCMEGTSEAELAAELLSLPFADSFQIFPKRALNSFIDTELEDNLEGVRQLLVVGDCTDLCIYQAALHLRQLANAHHHDWTVWVPADLVDTYDLSLEVAQGVGAPPHPGPLFHTIFLYHMKLNGIRVCSRVRC